MSLQSRLISCNDYGSFLRLLQDNAPLEFILEPTFGREKIKIGDAEEDFDIEQISSRIFHLSTRKIGEEEIQSGREVCRIFQGLWNDLGDQLKTLNCTAAIAYRVLHCSRFVAYTDWNPSWTEFWAPRSVMLKGSHGVFAARLNLSIVNKKLA